VLCVAVSGVFRPFSSGGGLVAACL